VPEIVKQRVWDRVREEVVETISAFQALVLHEPAVLERLVAALAVTTPALFHEPAFYAGFRAAVIPRLRTYPSFKIWQPCCGSGEDAFSLAILLQEEGLLARCRIYATDVAESVFRQAALGKIRPAGLTAGEANYQAAGGTRKLDGYVSRPGGEALMAAEVRNAVSFSAHSLATDDVFNEFEVIVCRHSVRLYDRWLQERVHALFNKSLSRFGMLCLGEGDVLMGTPAEQWYEDCQAGVGIYRRKS